MALNCTGRLPRTVIMAAIVLASGSALAWSQPADRPTDSWQEKLTGKWCDAERGCTHWWTLFEVRVGKDDRITIGYRDTRFVIFEGAIQDPIGTWMIKGKKIDKEGNELKPPEPFDAVVSDIELGKEVIEGKVKGTLKAKIQDLEIDGIRVQEMGGLTISDAKIAPDKTRDPETKGVKIKDATLDRATVTEPVMENSTIKAAKEIKAETMTAKRIESGKIEGKFAGGRQIEISVPLQISDATIEGTRKAKLKKARRGEEGGTAGEDDDDDGKRKIEIEATIKGKVTTPGGLTADWKGDFEGKFTALVQGALRGTYSVLPRFCSEAGEPLSDEQREDLAARRQRDPRPPTHTGSHKVRSPGRYRSLVEAGEQDRIAFAKKAEGEAGQRIAYATETRAARPAEPHTRGKFMRKVSGTVTAIAPLTITLDLPALPILDQKCRVTDEVPKRTLKLVKQHD